MSTERKKISAIQSLITTGVERPYSQAEQDAINQELFGEDWKEHERLKAEGKLDEIHIEDEEEEMEEWDESQIQEDDPDTEEALSNALYPDEDEGDEE